MSDDYEHSVEIGIVEKEQREMVIFFILDTSECMNEARIATLNQVMNDISVDLCTIAKNIDIHLKIAILSYNSEIKWITENGPEYIEDFKWENLDAKGDTNIGLALEELNDKLYTYVSIQPKNIMPIFIFVSSNNAIDDYTYYLNRLNKNILFQKSIKFGCMMDESIDERMLMEIVGNKECILDIKTLESIIIEKFGHILISMNSMIVGEIDGIVEDIYLVDVLKKERLELEQGYLEASYKKIKICQNMEIFKCQVCPCLPEDALKPYFLIKEFDKDNGWIRMKNIGFDSIILRHYIQGYEEYSLNLSVSSSFYSSGETFIEVDNGSIMFSKMDKNDGRKNKIEILLYKDSEFLLYPGDSVCKEKELFIYRHEQDNQISLWDEPVEW